MSAWLVVAGTLTAAASGFPGLLFAPDSQRGQWLTTALAVVGAGLGLAGVGWFWATGESLPIMMPWALPGVGLSLAVDGLSAVFLVPIFLILLLGSVYGLAYWKQVEHQKNGRKLRLFYGLLAAGMALVVTARNGILFLFAWEIMAVSAYFLVTTEDDQPEVRESGWIYLVATHVATMCLFAVFALLRAAGGSFELVALTESNATPAMVT